MRLASWFIRPALVSLVSLATVGCTSAPDDADHAGGGGKADEWDGLNVELNVNGLTEQAGQEVQLAFVNRFDTNKARRIYQQWNLHPIINPDGNMLVQTRISNGENVKVVAYVETDGIPGCSANDAIASSIATAGSTTVGVFLRNGQRWIAEDLEQELRDCNEVFAPRFDLKIAVTGFAGLDESVDVYVMPHAGYSSYDQGYGWLSNGVATIESAGALTAGRRERIVVFIDKDGLSGCSENDVVSVYETDPVTGSIDLSLTPQTVQRSADPARDLNDCNKFGWEGKPIGDYNVTVRGKGFAANEGQNAILGLPYRGVMNLAPIVNGEFELFVPKVVWEGSSANFVMLVDADGDSKCGGASDLNVWFDAGYATGDQVLYFKPEDLPTPDTYCW
ncbi:MAG: hypothetical protein AB7P03_23340 [Kofleriaceae bacterium]